MAIVTYNNKILTTGNPGGIASNTNCCCGTSCDSDYPEIYVTVFDADYLDGSGNLSWAGQTWTPAEVRAGTQKTACPTSYIKLQQVYTGTFAQSRIALERWAAASLLLARGYGIAKPITATSWYQIDSTNNIALNVKTEDDFFIFKGFDSVAPPFTHTYTATYYSSLGILNKTASIGQFSDYRITNNYFSSKTIGGITYTWARGAGW